MKQKFIKFLISLFSCFRNKKIGIILITGILCFFIFSFIKLQPRNFDHEVRLLIINGENYFAQGEYKFAKSNYKKALKIIKTPSLFLTLRYKMATYLEKINELVKQGKIEKVDEILKKSNSKGWTSNARAIFNSHCKNFIPKIQKLQDYKKNIYNFINLIKKGRNKKAQKILLEILEEGEKHNISIKFLRKQIINEIIEGNSNIFLIAWQYNDKLNIKTKDIYKELHKTGNILEKTQKLLLTDEKQVTSVLYQKEIKIAQILSRVLYYPERKELAKKFLQAKKEISNLDEQLLCSKIALELDPFYTEAYEKNANIYIVKNDYKKASTNYQESYKNYSAKMLCKQGWCKFWEHNLSEAFKLWEKSLNHKQNFVNSHLGLSIIFFIFKNFEKSELHIKKIKNESKAGYILSLLLKKDFDQYKVNIKEIQGHIKGYLRICHAIKLSLLNKNRESLKVLNTAEKDFAQYGIKPIEILAYQAIIYKKTGDKKKAEYFLEKMIKQKIDKNASLFFSLLFLKDKEQEHNLAQLTNEWKQLWKILSKKQHESIQK